MADITWNGDDILAQLRDASVDGLRKAGEHLLKVSREEVPIQTGDLERSGAVSVDPRGREAAVSYDTPYAVRQHEDMTARHDPGKKSKYLEDPFNQESDTMLEIIAAGNRRALGG